MGSFVKDREIIELRIGEFLFSIKCCWRMPACPVTQPVSQSCDVTGVSARRMGDCSLSGYPWSIYSGSSLLDLSALSAASYAFAPPLFDPYLS